MSLDIRALRSVISIWDAFLTKERRHDGQSNPDRGSALYRSDPIAGLCRKKRDQLYRLAFELIALWLRHPRAHPRGIAMLLI